MASISWTGAAGDNNYNNPANWSPQQVPGAGDTVTINTAAATAINAGNDAVAGLTTNSHVTLNLADNTNYTIGSGTGTATFSNGGTFALNSGGNASNLIVGAAKLNLTGGGVVLLNNNNADRIYGAVASDVLNNINNLIEGGGQLGAGQLTFVNGAAGTVNANDATALIINTGTNTVTNAGLLESTNTGGLVIQSAVNNGTTGHVTAAGGNVYIQSGGSFQGGTLSTSGGGEIVVQYNNIGALDGTANAVTNTGTVAIQDYGTLSVLGSIANQGQILLQSAGNAAEFVIASPTVKLSGGGTVVLGDNGANYILGSVSTNVLDNVNNTISGAGRLGNGSIGLINETAGVIDATSAANRLYLNTGALTATNSGLIEDTGAAGLQINSAINDGAAGTLRAAGTGAFVALDSGTTIAGGTLATSGGGVILVEYNNTATLNGSVNAVTNTGIFDINDYGSLTLLGSIVNKGTINLLSTGDTAEFVVASPTLTLSGSGTMALSDNFSNYIFGAAATNVLDNVANTIKGAGQLGNGQLTLVNGASGIIDASGATNLLVINTSGETVRNSGLIEATGAAGLAVQSTTIDDSTGGTILAANSNVYLRSSTIVGGLLKTTGTGNIQVNFNQSATLDGSAQTVTNAGTLAVTDYGQLSLLGTFTNQGLLSLGSTGDVTDLIIGPGGTTPGTVTLTGGGALTLSDNSQNRIYGAIAGDTLINLNNTISGAGQLGVGDLTVVNDATISATGTNALTIQTGGETFTNNGLLEATNTGGLIINNTTISNQSGTVLAAGGNVYLQAATIAGGLINSSGGGAFVVQFNRAATLDGTAHAVTNKGVVDVTDYGALTIAGSIINDGSINLQSTGDITDVIVESATVTLSGGGTIVLGNSSDNRIYGTVATDTLLNLDNTILGAGQLGAGQLTVINDATIDDNLTTALTINTGAGSFTNNGLLESTNTGGLIISSTTISNQNGTIFAGGGGNIVLQAATIAGGVINSSGGGAFVTQFNNTSKLDGTAHAVTNKGSVVLGDYSTVNLAGAIINDGTVSLQSTGDITDLIIASSTVTLSGGGTVTLGDNAQNRIYGSAAANVLDNVNNTITGAGQLGAGQLTLVNAGTISAVGGNALIVNLGSTGTNSGQMLGLGAGGLIFQNGTYTNSGLIQADDGSNVTFQSGALLTNDSATGTLSGGTYGAVANGHGATLNLGNAAITTDNASLILSGTGAEITSGPSNATIETTLTTIDHNAQLQILAGRAYVTTNKLTNSGTIVLGGGMLTAKGLTDKTTALLTGFGTVNAKFNDAGAIVATGGKLDLKGRDNTIAGAVTGTGTLAFDRGTTTLNGGTTLGVSNIAVINNATLNIDASLSFAGTFDIVGNATIGGTGALTNSGLFEQTGQGSATIGVAFSNSGTVQINAGGTLAFTGGVGNTGLILDNGTFTDNSLLAGGNLTVGGSGAAATIATVAGSGNSTLNTLTIGGGTLNTSGTTLTVTGDYNNTAAGVGNAYNPFAGVTGTIDARGTKLGVIGVNGTNITTVNGTLTIAIAKGGTASFEIENTGAAGSAALRGALQTTVNGGNITGHNLSGPGVTAQDYGPIAAGATSGIFTIHYTNGALTGDAIHLASDFANVAGLTIDIVAAQAGAIAPPQEAGVLPHHASPDLPIWQHGPTHGWGAA